MRGSNTRNCGQMITDCLVKAVVPDAFRRCGHGNIGFIDALYERYSDIDTVSVRTRFLNDTEKDGS